MTMLINREILFELSYNRIEDFIDMFNKKNLAGLEDQFGMSPAIYCKLFSESGEEEISANFDLIHDRENFKLIYLYTAS